MTSSEDLTWRCIIDPPLPGARNMALDEALARRVGDSEAVLRLYAWDEPTASLGRNEPTSDAARGASGLTVVRRPTGGRAVLHHREVTYAVIAPLAGMGGARAAYRSINEALAGGLRSLGASVELAADGVGSTESLDAGPCFQSPASGEVVAVSAAMARVEARAPRKLVGSAQARFGRALLQHGSIMLSGSQARLAELDPTAAGYPQPATLEELVGPLAFADVADAVVLGMREHFGGSWSDGTYGGAERALAAELIDTKYATDAWTWRR